MTCLKKRRVRRWLPDPAPGTLVYQAAELKALYPISYADCFALACAINHAAVLVTGDPEFKIVEHLVKITWTTSKAIKLE